MSKDKMHEGINLTALLRNQKILIAKVKRLESNQKLMEGKIDKKSYDYVMEGMEYLNEIVNKSKR